MQGVRTSASWILQKLIVFNPYLETMLINNNIQTQAELSPNETTELTTHVNKTEQMQPVDSASTAQNEPVAGSTTNATQVGVHQTAPDTEIEYELPPEVEFEVAAVGFCTGSLSFVH